MKEHKHLNNLLFPQLFNNNNEICNNFLAHSEVHSLAPKGNSL